MSCNSSVSLFPKGSTKTRLRVEAKKRAKERERETDIDIEANFKIIGLEKIGFEIEVPDMVENL